MILAAGFGRRLRPLTDHTPKPLLLVKGKPLIQYHLERLAAVGIHDIVINHAWLGTQLEEALGDGAALGVSIKWSREQSPLETGGGIKRALPFLCEGSEAGPSSENLGSVSNDEKFALLNGDVYTDYPLEQLVSVKMGKKLVHLVLVPNPEFHPEGDFSLEKNGLVTPKQARGETLTYSGIALINPLLFADSNHFAESFPLIDVLAPAIAAGKVSGEIYTGAWSDVGTIDRLNALNAQE